MFKIFLLANLTQQHSVLPEITKGEICIPGYLYKKACNTCRCGKNGALICTKMACLDKEMIEEFNKKNAELNLRAGNRKESRTRRTLPDLTVGDCEPGKLYKKGCQICFCTDKYISECSQKSCKLKMTIHNLQDPENFETAFPVKNINKLPSLPHMASTCDVGKSYRVDCNICFCRDNGDLMCTSRMCPTSEGFKMVAAYGDSGASCKEGYINKFKCIQCDCVDGRTECTEIANCKQSPMNPIFLSNSKLSLDVNKDKCTPKMIYRVHCNKCYCQNDGTLRCTQKLCLNKSEAKKLEEQRIYLEKFGL